MEKHDIKVKCLDFATRHAGVQGFVASQVVNKANVFYEWVIEGDADNRKKRPVGRPSLTHKKARTS